MNDEQIVNLALKQIEPITSYGGTQIEREKAYTADLASITMAISGAFSYLNHGPEKVVIDSCDEELKKIINDANEPVTLELSEFR